MFVLDVSVSFLDDDTITDGLSMATIIDMAKDDVQSKVQNLTRTLQASDNGKHLTCVATHPAIPAGFLLTRRQLNVKCMYPQHRVFFALHHVTRNCIVTNLFQILLFLNQIP